MIQLNLLPDVKKEYLKSQKTKALVVSSSILVTIGALGVTLVLFLYVSFGQQLQLFLLDNDIKDRTGQLNAVADLSKYLTIQNQLKALPDLHNGKGIYSRLFDFLPVFNPNAPHNVKIATLQLISSDAEKTIVLTGTTANFESLNIFADTLTNAQISYKLPGSTEATTDKVFTAVSVQTSALAQIDNTKAVTFSIATTYNPAVFDARNKEVAVKVPNIITTPSVIGAPKAPVFGGAGDK